METIEDKMQKVAAEMAARVYEHAAWEAEKGVQSPIEKLMYVAFRCWELRPLGYVDLKVYNYANHSYNIPCTWVSSEEFPCGRILVLPQVTVGQYSVDFFCGWKAPKSYGHHLKWLAVECDGHEFHEKTKSQAAHDKARDRHLLSRDIPVMRFTGSQVWRDAEECVSEVVSYFETADDRLNENLPNAA